MLDVKPLSENFAAEIHGVDLAQPLSEGDFADLSALFFESQVLVLRDQHLTPGQQVAFTRRFGPLEVHVRKESRLPGQPEILVVSNIVDDSGQPIGAQDAGRFWHSDLSYKREPSLLSALYAIEVPTQQGRVLGDTQFASTIAAYEALPEAQKTQLARLDNVHSYAAYRAKNRAAQAAEQSADRRVTAEAALSAETLSAVPDIVAPIVRTHPVTKRKGLFVNEAHTSHIPGLPEAESEDLLQSLYRHITQPDFIYRHQWRPGDLLMWDNCAVQHKATFDYALPRRRLMHRTTVRGPAVA